MGRFDVACSEEAREVEGGVDDLMREFAIDDHSAQWQRHVTEHHPWLPLGEHDPGCRYCSAGRAAVMGALR